MTHVLNPVIEWLESFERESETWKAAGMDPEPFCRAARILRAEREGRRKEELEIARLRAANEGSQRGYAQCARDMEDLERDAEELRAEGRREERERLVDIGDEMAAMLDMATSLSDIDSEGAVTELLAEWRSASGDHWRGGEG